MYPLKYHKTGYGQRLVKSQIMGNVKMWMSIKLLLTSGFLNWKILRRIVAALYKSCVKMTEKRVVLVINFIVTKYYIAN